MNLIEKLYYFFPLNNFKSFWNKNRLKFKNKKFRGITDDFVNSKSYYLTSNLWHSLNITNFKQIINEGGLKNYSNTLALNYFTFLSVYDSQISKLIDNLKNSDSFGNFNIYKKQKYLNYKQSIQYNYLTSLLYLNLKKKKYYKKIFNLSDKGYLGFNDPFILIDGIKVTSDKINSLFDYEYINSFYDLTKKNIKVLEIGAGAARTSDTILTYNKNMKYIICDIPPSIFTGYIRLKKRFPKKKIIFSHNFNKNELIKAIDKNDIIFIFPDQLSLLPQNSINLTLAIDCLHEMENKNLYHIFKNVERFAENFYFSVWKKTTVPHSFSFNNFSRTSLYCNKHSDNYPKLSNFKRAFSKDLIFPATQIAIGYKKK